jgi:hypothetical protein
MDGYFGIFSLKNHTLRVFCQDGEANSERNGFCYDSKGFKIIFIGFDAIGFLKIGGGKSLLLLLNTHFTSNPFDRLRVVPSGMVRMTL